MAEMCKWLIIPGAGDAKWNVLLQNWDTGNAPKEVAHEYSHFSTLLADWTGHFDYTERFEKPQILLYM